MAQQPTAAKIAEYLNIYRGYLETNNLEDDSDEILVIDLIYFVDVLIDDEEREGLRQSHGKTPFLRFPSLTGHDNIKLN